jgi:uncharacterized protein (TIGR02246 family)
MYLKKSLLFTTAMALLVAGPVFGQYHEKDPADAGIQQLLGAYVAAYNGGSIEKTVELYADDAMVMYEGQPALKGKDAIRVELAEALAGSPKLALESMAVLSIDEDTALNMGHFKVSFEMPDGEWAERTGYWMSVNVKSDYGWRIMHLITNSDTPMVPADM